MISNDSEVECRSIGFRAIPGESIPSPWTPSNQLKTMISMDSNDFQGFPRTSRSSVGASDSGGGLGLGKHEEQEIATHGNHSP